MTRRLHKHKPHQKYYLRSGPNAGQEVMGASTVSGLAESYEGLIRHNWKRGRDGLAYGADKDAAAEAGTISHGLIEAWFLGDTLDLDDFTTEGQELGHLTFEKFKNWYADQNMDFMFAELQLVSHDHEYGGTLDLMTRDITKLRCLIDFKTSKSIRTSHGIQACAYGGLWNENFFDEPIDRVCILHLPKDGSDVKPYWLPPETFAYYKQSFLANLAAYKARQSLDKVCPIALASPWFKRKKS